MIDTIHGYLTIPKERFLSINDLQKVLDNTSSFQKHEDFGFFTGYLKNIKVTANYRELDHSIIRINFRGSIPKYLYGNNLASCSPSDILQAEEAMSEALGMDLSKASISRLDFGVNLVVSQSVPLYINSIHGCKKMAKSVYPGESVTFTYSYRAVTFYDKIEEMVAHAEDIDPDSIPDFIDDINILRFEVRLLKQVYKQLGLDSIQFNDLSSSKLHVLLADFLITVFSDVVIGEFEVLPENLISQRGWLKDFLAMIGLESYGYDRIMDLIDSLEFDVKAQRQKRSNLRKGVRELVSQSSKLHSTSIKSELDGKLGALYGILI